MHMPGNTYRHGRVGEPVVHLPLQALYLTLSKVHGSKASRRHNLVIAGGKLAE